MAVNPLSLAESLRAWHAAGIRCFLASNQDGSQEGAFARLPDSLDCQYEEACFADEGSAAVPGEVPQDGGGKYGRAGMSRAAAPTPPQRIRTPKSATTVLPAKAEEHYAPTGPDVPADSWPKAWRELYARSKPAPILWTYPELGQDLAGRGDKVRSACLRDFISRLQLPRGTSVFWPLGLRASDDGPSGEFPAEPEYFKAGLRLLQPKAVVFIGARSVEMAELGLALGTPFTQKIFQGIFFVLLPEFSALLERPSLVDKSCVFLRTSLGGLPSVFQARQRP